MMDEQTDRLAALAERYGPDATIPDGPWNAVIRLMLNHRSVRAYSPDPLPPGTLETLIAAAQSAATSSNMQSWSVVAVTDPARKARLAAIADGQKQVLQCPLLLMFIIDQGRHLRIGERHGRSMEAVPLLESFLVGAIDCGIAAQNAVLAAESLGLATVYMGAMRNDPEAVTRELKLPAGSTIAFGLCVGYPAEGSTGSVKPRLPQTVALHQEEYATSNEDAELAAYDRRVMAFSERAERSPYSWTERVFARLAHPSALNGRDILRTALSRLGFPLA